jgi:CHAT domain-containing protein
LGSALELAGSPESAAVELRAAIALSESEAATIHLNHLKSAFLADKLDVYAHLALLEKSRRRTSNAFAVSELMRSRQLLDMLARGRIARNTQSSAHEQDLRRRIAFLSRQIDSSSRGSSNAREAATATAAMLENRMRLEKAQKEYADLLLRIREDDPAYATLVAAPSVTWKDVAARLGRDEVLIEYLIADPSSMAFVITRDSIVAIDIPASRERIGNLVEFTRKAMQPSGSMQSRALWKRSLRSLYTILISPVENAGALRGRKNLLIVPHADLYFLSFASLIAPGSADRFLIERFGISYAPSAAVWFELAKRPQARPRGAVIALAPSIDRLPASRTEVENMGRIYGRNLIAHFGADATRSSLQRDLPRASVIHLATFGVLNRHNPLFSFVALAPSAVDDGRLEVHDVFGLPLRGQTVILSACQSALGSGVLADVPAGDDWVGLVQAFLSAGARSVVATLWPVDDRATSELMTEFHRQLASGQPMVSALANAQRRMIRTSRNPSYWAGFTLSGHAE